MKKYLLGALFIMSAAVYSQDNQVIVPVVDGNATANLGIEVTGRVFDPADLSLVVEIKSAASANGTGFAFTMPNMFAGEKNVKTVQGDFDVYVRKNVTSNGTTTTTKYPLQGLKIDLVQAGTAAGTATTDSPAGTASGVTLDYSLVGGTAGTAGAITHNGGVVVKATTTDKTTVGTYSDTSVQLRVAVTGQTIPVVPGP